MCAIFAERVLVDKGFAVWLLSQTKFAAVAKSVDLLAEEQAKRPAKAWWRHWWCSVKDTGRQSETDILLVFKDGERRVALHIENKFSAPLVQYQADDYAPRARQMMKNKWVSYDDFETIIIAPKSYLLGNIAECKKFDRMISYERIGQHIPEYETVVRRNVK
ncbi:hypothetical protein ASC80_13815 [Afipia sp. Root123D2]|nr:hypothetical protein ASC80_13815 [Afipia sp. Root123D2]